MTNKEKAELRWLCRNGSSFEEIKTDMGCADSTIRRYMKIFSPKRTTPKGERRR